MFEQLEAIVREQTRPNKARNLDTYVRTLCVPVSRSLKSLLEDYRLSFPLRDRELDPLLSSTPFCATSESFVQEFAKLLDKALAADLVPRLADKGFSVLSTINLVIVFADFQESGTLESLPGVVRAIEASCAQRKSSGNAFYFIGGFIVRRGRGSGEDNQAQALPDDWKKRIADIAGQFSRIYLLDQSDSQGKEIDARDQHRLLENLVHMLTAVHADCTSEHEFAEWLSRGHANLGEVDFLGGASIYLPVDQMMEIAAVTRGAQALRRALLGKPPVSRAEVWAKTFQQEQRMVTLEDAHQWLRSCHGLNLDPISALEPAGNPRIYLDQVERLDAALPRICEDNEKCMRAFSNDKTRELEQVLGRYLNSIISLEESGLAAAVEFLELLTRRLLEVSNPDSAEARYGDPHSEQARLRDLLDKAPTDEALIARAGLGTGAVASCAAGFHSDFGPQLEVSALGLITFGAVSFALRHINKEQIRNSIVRIDGLERAKWDAISTTAETRIIKEWFDSLQSTIESLKGRLKSAIDRIQVLCELFENKYSPDFPPESAIKLLLLRDRTDCERFFPLVSECAQASIATFIPGHEFLWYRLAEPKAPKPNAWESDFFESAAISALPHCGALLSLSVASILQQEPSTLTRFLNRIQVSVSPFGHVAAGVQEGQLVLLLEATDLDSSPVLKDIIAKLKGRWGDRVHPAKFGSPYHLLLYSRQENVTCESVELQGGR